MITVYYDGKCHLCNKEIRYYRTIAPETIFHWQDVTELTDQQLPCTITQTQCLKLLHAVEQTNNETQKIYIGVDAFILIWKNLPKFYWRWLAGVISLPIIRQLTNAVYKLFAHWRFKRLPYCKLS